MWFPGNEGIEEIFAKLHEENGGMPSDSKRSKARAITTGPDAYGLRDQLQKFADEYCLPDHISDERGAEIILQAFKQKIAGELKLLGVSVDQ